LEDALAAIPESDFQASVIDHAHLTGWLVGFTFDSRRSETGEPDLRMVHEEWRRYIVAECKTEDGELTKGRWVRRKRKRGNPPGEVYRPGQDDWARALSACPGVEYYLWRPRDLDQIQRILSSGHWRQCGFSQCGQTYLTRSRELAEDEHFIECSRHFLRRAAQ